MNDEFNNDYEFRDTNGRASPTAKGHSWSLDGG